MLNYWLIAKSPKLFTDKSSQIILNTNILYLNKTINCLQQGQNIFLSQYKPYGAIFPQLIPSSQNTQVQAYYNYHLGIVHFSDPI